jgi:hypothetical protein
VTRSRRLVSLAQLDLAFPRPQSPHPMYTAVPDHMNCRRARAYDIKQYIVLSLYSGSERILWSGFKHNSSELNSIFENLESAKKFYLKTVGLELCDEQIGHYAKFGGGAGFVCLEQKGAESYPSKDKAVPFFEVPDLTSAIAAIGQDRLVRRENKWAALHDPEGHNILLLQRPN